MNSTITNKNLEKQKDREATIRHYILGYILECVVKNDLETTYKIKEFLVNDLKIITEENFVYCLYRARLNRVLMIKGTKKNYRLFKKVIVLRSFERKEQLFVIKRMKEFAEGYSNGLFIKPNMVECSFEETSKN